MNLRTERSLLNANFSSEMLESIFATTTPLHDGAVIVRDMTIVAAAVILPLAEDRLPADPVDGHAPSGRARLQPS